ncbi:MAG: transglutaminase domain-containing protein [Planctomycetaceae bacterium]|nr:transglutaminase domain-containing protein [Planctomycetaceae bacterium]
MKKLLLCCFLLLNACFPEYVHAQTLTSDVDYKATLGPVRTVEVEFAAIVTAPYHTKILKVWMPLPQSDVAQKISDRSFHVFPGDVKPSISSEKKYGNRFAYFEFKNPQGAQIIRQKFRVEVSELSWKLKPREFQTITKWPAMFDRYLEQPIEVAMNGEFQEIIRQIQSRSQSVVQRSEVGLFSAMKWIDKNLTYDHVIASLQADPLHALTHKRGHCSDYHGLCAALGRSLGYPTRVTYGLQLFPKSSPSHCKMEAFISPYGWVSFDLSETQKLIAKLEESDREDKEVLIENLRDRMKQGYRENSWVLLTRGTNYELSPPASAPVKVVRTIYAEADGVPLPEPDPSNEQQGKFAWMTAHKFTSEQPLEAAFKNLERLKSYSTATPK